MHIRLRPVADYGVDALCRLVGRPRMVRAARFLLHRSRWDLPNHPARNGETALHGWLLRALPATAPVTVLDVGANVGRWSGALLARAATTGHRVDLHAFEPAADTYRMLVANLPGTARAHRLALSDLPGQAVLHVLAPGAGRNSLHPTGEDAVAETVPASTLDLYAESARLRYVHLVKIDTEGHDLRVLRGATGLLSRLGIGAVQFEYNHRWVHSRSFLKDAFDLLAPFGYRIGKLTPRGVEWYPGWDPELETFVEGNYLACTLPVARQLPALRWWKEASPACTSA